MWIPARSAAVGIFTSGVGLGAAARSTDITTISSSSEFVSGTVDGFVSIPHIQIFQHLGDSFTGQAGQTVTISTIPFDTFQTSHLIFHQFDGYSVIQDYKQETRRKLRELIRAGFEWECLANDLQDELKDLFFASDKAIDETRKAGWSSEQTSRLLDSILDENRALRLRRPDSLEMIDYLIYFEAVVPAISYLAKCGWTPEMQSDAICEIIVRRDPKFDARDDMIDAFYGLLALAKTMAGFGWKGDRQSAYFKYLVNSCKSNVMIGDVCDGVCAVMLYFEDAVGQWSTQQQYANIPFFTDYAMLLREYEEELLLARERNDAPPNTAKIDIIDSLWDAVPDPAHRSHLFSVLFRMRQDIFEYERIDFGVLEFLSEMAGQRPWEFRGLMKALEDARAEGFLRQQRYQMIEGLMRFPPDAAVAIM